MKIIILEDEAKAARELAGLIRETDDLITIEAQLDSVERAVSWLSTNPHPDLIFSDIQLADGLCFELFEKVNVKSPVIFCTAFDEYLLNAFETNAVSYLLKPVSAEKVEKALEKFNSLKTVFSNETQNYQQLVKHVSLNLFKTTILVHHKEKIIPVSVKDIACITLENSLVQLFTFQQQRYFLSQNMDELENMLNPDEFFRTNRQSIVQKSAILSAERFFSRKLNVKLSIPVQENIVVSKAKSTAFLQWLEH